MLKIITLIILINFLWITKSADKFNQDEWQKNEDDWQELLAYPYADNSRLIAIREVAMVNTNKAWQAHGKDYLKESPDQCSAELKPQYFCHWGTTSLSDKPHFFIDFFTEVTELNSTEIINKTKQELATLNKEKTKEYVRQIASLLFAIDNDDHSSYAIHFKSEVKWLVWNRILLAKETFEDLLKKREPFNPQHHSPDYYMECLQISTAYNQLARIKKEHIDQLWKNLATYNLSGKQRLEYEDWLQRKERPPVNFLSLIVDIFAPITDCIIPPQKNFDEYEKYFGNEEKK